MAARRAQPDPTAEEKLPHPIIQSVPKLHKTIRHQVRPVYPTSIGTPPAEAPMHRRPPHQSRAQAHAQPMLPAAHQPGPKPPRPRRNPNPEARAPPDPQTPPPDNSGNSTAARLATYVRRHRHPQQRRMPPPEKQHPESPIPHPGQGGSPSAEPPKKPTPREPPDAPGPYCHPTPTTKTTADRIGTPPTLGDELIKGAQRDWSNVSAEAVQG